MAAQLPPGVDPSKIPFAQPPPGQVSNFVNPPSLAPVAEGIGGLLIAIETILLFLRTCSNIKAYGRLRFEDFWIIWATLLTYGYFALLMIFRPIARDEWNIPLTAASKSLYKSVFAQEMMLGSVLFFAKTSLLFVFWRFFSVDKYFRYKVYGAFIFLGLTTLSSIPMYLAICIPTGGDTWAESSIKCQKTSVYGYVQGPAGVAYDLFMLYLPASVVLRLQLKSRRKIGILLIFATGMLAVVASIIGLVYRVKLIKGDSGTRQSYIVELCLLIEACVSIICCCLPATPAISRLIAENNLVTTLRSRLLSRYASSGRSKASSDGVSRRPHYPEHKPSEDLDPYLMLTYASQATETTIKHDARAEPSKSPGINKSIELEVLTLDEPPAGNRKV